MVPSRVLGAFVTIRKNLRDHFPNVEVSGKGFECTQMPKLLGCNDHVPTSLYSLRIQHRLLVKKERKTVLVSNHVLSIELCYKKMIPCFLFLHESPFLPSFLLSFLLSFFLLFRATPVAYGSSQARDQTRATAASLQHSHSNSGSKPSL